MGKQKQSSPAPESLERLSLAFRDLEEISDTLIQKYAPTLRELDLSHNNISDISALRDCKRLETLVLDNNKLTHNSKIPRLEQLHTLWVNRNQISNLTSFIERLVENTPNLKYLSMLNNEACPNFFNGGTLKQYKDYRLFVISRLHKLTTLDSSPVTREEREEATRLYGSLLPQKVAKDDKERQAEAERLERERKEAEEKRQKELEEVAKKEQEERARREEKHRLRKQQREQRRRLWKKKENERAAADEEDSEPAEQQQQQRAKRPPNGSPAAAQHGEVSELPDLPATTDGPQSQSPPPPPPPPTAPAGFSYLGGASLPTLQRGPPRPPLASAEDVPALPGVYHAADSAPSSDWSSEDDSETEWVKVQPPSVAALPPPPPPPVSG